MKSPEDSTKTGSPLDAIISDYLHAVDLGQVPNRKELLDRHPNLAEALQAFFADFDRLDRQAAPLRHEDDPNATGAEPGSSSLPTIRYFGDYELLEEIARGGMGIVYKARQKSLNRIVALKMILKGTFATPVEVARFRAEAEAAANLDHPHIVPIYEVGEHEGQQYFSMKFIEGEPLARSPRVSPRVEAERMVAAAGAVHYAHQRGILHRDLKPSNILIDSTGVLYVGDFGLAKRLTDTNRSLTETGQLLGTPRYMAPEQAAMRKDLTVAADVYSLGVILYERLAGQTPFTGDDVLTVLRRVRETEAPRPSAIVPGLDRDLETVVLKCLEKAPLKRYANAEALADDVSRWLRCEPILARPVGRADRFLRWCRRNPTVASLSVAAATALVIGTTASSTLAVIANRRAERAETAEEKLIQTADKLEAALGKSLMRPISTSRSGWGATGSEADALWELAGSDTGSFRLRVLQEAVNSEFRASQLHARSDEFLVASIGLNLALREKVSQIFSSAMRDSHKSLTHRSDIAWALLEISPEGTPQRDESARVIEDYYAAPEALHDTALIQLEAPRLPSRDAAQLLLRAFAAFQSQPDGMRLFEAIESTVPHLGKSDAAILCREVVRLQLQSMKKENDPFNYTFMPSYVDRLLKWVEPTEIPALCSNLSAELLAALESGTGSDDANVAVLARYIADFGLECEPNERTRIAERAIGFISRRLKATTNAISSRHLAVAMGTVAKITTQTFATSTCRPVIEQIVLRLRNEKNLESRWSLAEGLVSLVEALEPTDSVKYVSLALEDDARTMPDGRDLVEGPDRMGKTLYIWPKRLGSRVNLAGGLCNAATKLDAATGSSIIFEALKAEVDSRAMIILAKGLASISYRLDERTANSLVQSAAIELDIEFKKSTNGRRANIAEAVSALVEQSGDARLVDSLLVKLNEELDSQVRWRLADGIQAGAYNLSEIAGKQICSRAAAVVARSILSETAQELIIRDVLVLSRLMACLQPEEATGLLKKVYPIIVEKLGEYGEDAEFCLSHLIRFAAPARSKELARLLARRIADPRIYKDLSETLSPEKFTRVENLQRFLTGSSLGESRHNAVSVMSCIGNMCVNLHACLLLMPNAMPSISCCLETQDLVEMLKFPTCVGEVRRVILDQLGNRYGQRFATHWDFVRYAEEHNLNLDFTTPPTRPDTKLPQLFEN